IVSVPNGTGTVHVTVRSGIIATDNNSSNPNANVTKPVFGYGTSQSSAADQFTYAVQTVSATNSTVSFATPTVPSGGTDQVTIVVKDAAGNAISGLTNSAFTF